MSGGYGLSAKDSRTPAPLLFGRGTRNRGSDGLINAREPRRDRRPSSHLPIGSASAASSSAGPSSRKSRLTRPSKGNPEKDGGGGCGSCEPEVPYHYRHPAYVRACSANEYKHPYGANASWWVLRHPVGAPEKAQKSAYKCRSWRCPVCRRWVSARDYERLAAVLLKEDHRSVVMLTLTVDRYGTFTGRPEVSPEEVQKDLARRFLNLKRMLNRWLVRRGFPPIGNKWVRVIEAHRSGWPHLHVVVVSEGLAEYLRADYAKRQANGVTELHDLIKVDGELAKMVEAVGFGRISAGEVARNVGALCNYAAKLSGEFDSSMRELAKLTQRPLNAKKRLRTFQAGRRFVEPRVVSNPETTGGLASVREKINVQTGEVTRWWRKIGGGETVAVAIDAVEKEEGGFGAAMEEAEERALAARERPSSESASSHRYGEGAGWLAFVRLCELGARRSSGRDGAGGFRGGLSPGEGCGGGRDARSAPEAGEGQRSG